MEEELCFVYSGPTFAGVSNGVLLIWMGFKVV